MMDSSTSGISGRMVTRRAYLRLSQQEVAALAGIAPTQFYRYESGRTKPRPVMADRLADALKVSTSWLLTGEGEMERSKSPDLEIPHKKPSVQAGHVYVCDARAGLIKIGQSASPERRLKGIAGAVGCDNLRTWISPKILEYKRVERLAHHSLQEWRAKGEWFKCSMELAVSTVQRLVKDCGQDEVTARLSQLTPDQSGFVKIPRHLLDEGLRSKASFSDWIWAILCRDGFVKCIVTDE